MKNKKPIKLCCFILAILFQFSEGYSNGLTTFATIYMYLSLFPFIKKGNNYKYILSAVSLNESENAWTTERDGQIRLLGIQQKHRNYI